MFCIKYNKKVSVSNHAGQEKAFVVMCGFSVSVVVLGFFVRGLCFVVFFF